MKILNQFELKNILILGFGREGKSTYKFIRKLFPTKKIFVNDGNLNLDISVFESDKNLIFNLGEDYLKNLNNYDIIIKTPGISLKHIELNSNVLLTSQTSIFLDLYGHQTVGITGTKGKSTTTTLLNHILKLNNKNTIIAGNIGIPLFDIIDNIDKNTVIVCEFSAHQLENTHSSPHLSILLNLHQEHLDHFKSYENYKLAKFNIAIFQKKDDFFIYNQQDKEVLDYLKKINITSNIFSYALGKELEKGCFTEQDNIIFKNEEIEEIICKKSDNISLKGKHNLSNILSVIIALKILNINNSTIIKGLKTYQPLPHRIEFVCKKNNILFYNDSISTIPEATIEALKTLKIVDTLILGGVDRGIDYSILINYLLENPVRNIFFVGNAGKRIYNELKEKNIFAELILESDYKKIVEISFEITTKDKICLLSPAAASYDQFINFENRGNNFKELILEF